VETELIVAEVNERRPVRRASGSYKTDVLTQTELYKTLIEHLDQLPVYDEVLSTPVHGWHDRVVCSHIKLSRYDFENILKRLNTSHTLFQSSQTIHCVTFSEP